MTPEERALLERTLKLSEENNLILQKIQKTARRAVIWGLIKVAIIVLPLIAGYILLQPFLGQAVDNFNNVQELLKI